MAHLETNKDGEITCDKCHKRVPMNCVRPYNLFPGSCGIIVLCCSCASILERLHREGKINQLSDFLLEYVEHI